MADSASWTAVLPVVGTLLGAIVGIVGNHLVSRDKHRRDKTWERRVEVYSRAISGLTRAIQIGESVGESYAEDPERAYQDERVSALEADMWDAHRNAVAAIEENFVLVSDEVADCMDRLSRRLYRLEDEIPPVRHREAMQAMTEELRALVEVARREVRP